MDNAILSKGESHSDFKGINNKELIRDKTRCTLQFYKVTDTKEVPEAVFRTWQWKSTMFTQKELIREV